MSLFKILHRVAAPVAAVMFAVAATAPAHAAPILSVTGDSDASKALGPFVLYKGAAAGFTLGADYTDVSITIDALCLGCAGDLILYRGAVGPTAIPSGITAVGTFDEFSPSIGLNNIAALESGDYFFVVGPTVGGIVWIAAEAPNIVDDGVSSNNADLLIATPKQTSFINSEYVPFDGYFHFSVEGTSAVPLPGAIWLFIAGLGFLVPIGMARSRRT